MILTNDIRDMTPQDAVARPQLRETPIGEYFVESVKEQLDKGLSISAGAQELAIQAKEREAYGGMAPFEYDPEVGVIVQTLMPAELGHALNARDIPAENRMSEEDFKNHPLDPVGKGIEYTRDMNEVRLGILADRWQERRKREQLLQNGPGGLGGTLLGFGAGMLVGAVDPASWVGLGATGSVMRRIGMAAAEGGLGNLAVDAFNVPRLQEQGEDVTVTDIAMNAVFGAAAGGVLSTLNVGIQNRLDARALRRARQAMRPEEMRTLAAAVEVALDDIALDNPVDVTPLVQSQAQTFAKAAQQAQRVQQALAEFEPVDTFMDAPAEAMQRSPQWEWLVGNGRMPGQWAGNRPETPLTENIASGWRFEGPEAETAADDGLSDFGPVDDFLGMVTRTADDSNPELKPYLGEVRDAEARLSELAFGGADANAMRFANERLAWARGALDEARNDLIASGPTKRKKKPAQNKNAAAAKKEIATLRKRMLERGSLNEKGLARLESLEMAYGMDGESRAAHRAKVELGVLRKERKGISAKLSKLTDDGKIAEAKAALAVLDDRISAITGKNLPQQEQPVNVGANPLATESVPEPPIEVIEAAESLHAVDDLPEAAPEPTPLSQAATAVADALGVRNDPVVSNALNALDASADAAAVKIAELREAGKLLPGEEVALGGALEAEARAKRYADGLIQAAECIVRNA